MSNIAVRFYNVKKSFNKVEVLHGINFVIEKGEVHALLGENGAGKSTLLNILHGIYPEYDGTVEIFSEKVAFDSTLEAIHFGIAKVHQEINLVEELTVGQNIVLGYEPLKKFGLIDYKAMHAKANAILKRLECNFKSEDSIKGLSAGEMQMILIAKALYHNAKIISFDEPTASLSNKDTEILFKIINQLKNNGITILYVSHRLEEVFQITDRATILRDGSYIGTYKTAEIDKKFLIKQMVGRDVASFATRHNPSQKKDNVVLEVENLCREGEFSDISFNLHEGEILGFAGLVGAKRTEVVRAIFGADRADSGIIKVKGKKVKILSPNDGLAAGIALLPENRKTEGVIQYLTNADNMAMASLKQFGNVFVNNKVKTDSCRMYMDRIDVNPKDPNYITSNLSGGNQQKIVLAKWLASDSDIIIFDEPTKGIDIGAKAEIYALLEEMVAQGKSIIIVSSELPEVLGMSDRILVMHAGRIVKEGVPSELSEEKILSYAIGEGGHE